jgi:hypothetical protein
MPSVGERVELPTTLTTQAGEVIPAIVKDRKTFFLIISTSCPVCQREVVTHYPSLLPMVEANGFALRMVAIPSSPVDDEWFFERIPPETRLVLDTLGIARNALRVRVTPSVVIVASDGTVEAVFSPSREWPITEELLAQLDGMKLQSFR